MKNQEFKGDMQRDFDDFILANVGPYSTASGERTFSTARRIKTWLRAKMNQERFNSVAVLNTHRTDKIDIIANNFVCNENRLHSSRSPFG